MEKLLSLYNPQIVSPINALGGEAYANRIIPILIYVGFVLCILAFVFLLMIGGIEWITSSGNKQSLENARSKIMNAVTGLVVLFVLWLIIRTMNVVFGINIGEVGVFESRTPTSVPTTVPTSTPVVPTTTVTIGPTPTTGYSQGNCTGVAGQPGACSCNCPLGYLPVEPSSCNGAVNCSTTSCNCYSYATTYCNDSSQCSPGSFCSTVDFDSDGFFAEGSGICTVGVADCNDQNANVYPGQPNYFESPITGTNFDYDCSGTNDIWPRLNCLYQGGGTATCMDTPIPDSTLNTATGWVDYIPACGERLDVQMFSQCAAYSGLSCVAFASIYADCNMGCVTGNICGLNMNEPCTRWNVNGFPVIFDISYLDMPCK